MEYLYIISCPITNFVIYVGKTNNPRFRWGCHKRADGKHPIGLWCKAMISIGLHPIFKIHSEFEFLHNEEDLLIDHYRSLGMATFNRTTTWRGAKTRPYKRHFGYIQKKESVLWYRSLFRG